MRNMSTRSKAKKMLSEKDIEQFAEAEWKRI
jgi:hypothetical protein